MFNRNARVAGAALAVALLTVAPVCAQGGGQETRRPYRGLFGGPVSPDTPQSLMLSASVFAAYDDNVYEALSQRRTSAPWLQKKGAYQGANVALSYGISKRIERYDLRGHAGSQLNYFRHPDRSDVLPAAQAGASLGVRLTKRLRLDVRQSAAYTSTYSGSLAPRPDEDTGHDISLPPEPGLELFELRALRMATSASLAQELGRHLSLTGGYHFRTFRVLETETADSRFRDYDTQAASVGVEYARPMTRHATLKLGYGVRFSDRRSRTGEPSMMHNVDAGVDYARALSFSRRTSLRFGTGSSIAVNEGGDGANANRRTRARLTGMAALVHELGRTWTAELAYTRGFRTRDGFGELYFTDAVLASIGGLVTRRLSASANASWADSSLEYAGVGRHRGQSASAQATYALTGSVAAYANYFYYYYSYGDAVPLDDRFSRKLDRHGIRVGLTTSVPLIR